MVELNKTLGLGVEEEEGGFYSVLGWVGNSTHWAPCARAKLAPCARGVKRPRAHGVPRKLRSTPCARGIQNFSVITSWIPRQARYKGK